jgi:hypothetical protein
MLREMLHFIILLTQPSGQCLAGVNTMNTLEQQHFAYLYHQHLINLTLQGKRPATIDAYSRAVRRITAYFDRTPDTLSTKILMPLSKLIHGVPLNLSAMTCNSFTATHLTVRGNGSALQLTFRARIRPVSKPSKKAIRVCPCCQHEMKCVG